MKYEVVITRPGGIDRFVIPLPNGSKEDLERWCEMFNKHSPVGVTAYVQERKAS